MTASWGKNRSQTWTGCCKCQLNTNIFTSLHWELIISYTRSKSRRRMEDNFKCLLCVGHNASHIWMLFHCFHGHQDKLLEKFLFFNFTDEQIKAKRQNDLHKVTQWVESEKKYIICEFLLLYSSQCLSSTWVFSQIFSYKKSNDKSQGKI